MAELITPQLKEVFDQVAKIGTDLRSGAMKASTFKPIAWYQEQMNTLTGDFMFLSAELGRLKAARDSNEISAYMISKNDADTAGEKFTSALGERIAKFAVKDLDSAVRVVESYLEAAEQGILTCKKDIEIEMLELQREVK